MEEKKFTVFSKDGKYGIRNFNEVVCKAEWDKIESGNGHFLCMRGEKKVLISVNRGYLGKYDVIAYAPKSKMGVYSFKYYETTLYSVFSLSDGVTLSLLPYWQFRQDGTFVLMDDYVYSRRRAVLDTDSGQFICGMEFYQGKLDNFFILEGDGSKFSAPEKKFGLFRTIGEGFLPMIYDHIEVKTLKGGIFSYIVTVLDSKMGLRDIDDGHELLPCIYDDISEDYWNSGFRVTLNGRKFLL